MEKKYCKNCKYYAPSPYDYCNCIVSIREYDNPINGRQIGLNRIGFNLQKENENYDCDFYKRKWWKFWV